MIKISKVVGIIVGPQNLRKRSRSNPRNGIKNDDSSINLIDIESFNML